MSGTEQNIEQMLRDATSQLDKTSDSARLDAEVLLSHVLNKTRSYLLAFNDAVPAHSEQNQFQELIQRRINGEPVAHITGQREFWSLNLNVTADTLIPRPDTELLIEFILNRFDKDCLKLIDMGTGSGAIALALTSERPEWKITASDKSAKALAVAQNNAQQLDLTNIQFVQSNWFEAIEKQPFDIIVSNPPYICSNDPHLNQGDVRFEPVTALASGSDGLDDIRLLISQATQYLNEDGWLILEHGYDQKQAVKQLFAEAGYRQITQLHDYGQNPRLSAGCRPI